MAVDYPTQEAANQAAIEACQQRNSRCTVVLSIQNECGAAVQGLIQGNILVNNEVRPIYWFGKGPTATAAQQSALDGANRILTNNPVMNAGSGQIVQAPTVLDTICTSNAG
ncbi:DUF4189 domain-containing protein [Nocardia huaxiensis]|uniref:DUF4189 domain-containing protein n=1 Tax=Nocardia huaxiensis TaxID=2755382 RepID=UPI001E2D062D|nr:DUF4189 domain-containing protein [Nocardia huaxiensis]UFS93190.1 DUF4189 domain-containing protein [Nocardia huaxiensis]